MKAISSKDDWTLADAQALQLDHHSPVYQRNCAALVNLVNADGLTSDEHEALQRLQGWNGSHLAKDIAPTLYYRWMYRTIQGAMADEFDQAADSTATEKFETWHRTIVSENSFPRLLANLNSPWWDDISTAPIETAQDVVTAAMKLALTDLQIALGEDPNLWHYDRLHAVTHKHAMADVPILGRWLSVGSFEVGAAKDALCKYEFKLKEEVDYSIFSGPSMRIGIDFADIGAAESILPTGQSGNVFSPYYDNQAVLYHSGLFRKMRMDREDIMAHASATAAFTP